MTDLLRPGFAIDALTATIATELLPPAQISSGSPSAGALELVAGETEIGIWEHSPGTSTDVEADEVFVVLSGSAIVEFIESGDVLRLAPGAVARFAAGTATRWTVTETIRKIYIA
jgi:uncharacterized protein